MSQGNKKYPPHGNKDQFGLPTLLIRKGSFSHYRYKNRYNEWRYQAFVYIPAYNSPFWDQFDKYLIAIPKTASHGIGQELDPRACFGHLWGCEYPVRIRHQLVTIVRNPYDRLVSAYFFMKRGGFGNPKYLEITEKYPTFKKWVLEGLSREELSYDGLLYTRSYAEAYFPQTDWLIENRESNELIIPDSQIGRFENLQEDVKRLLGIELQTHKNVSTDREKDWRVYYTNVNVRKKVEQLYRKDFELLGYEYYRPNTEENQTIIQFKEKQARTNETLKEIETMLKNM